MIRIVSDWLLQCTGYAGLRKSGCDYLGAEHARDAYVERVRRKGSGGVNGGSRGTTTNHGWLGRGEAGGTPKRAGGAPPRSGARSLAWRGPAESWDTYSSPSDPASARSGARSGAPSGDAHERELTPDSPFDRSPEEVSEPSPMAMGVRRRMAPRLSSFGDGRAVWGSAQD